MPLPSAHSEPAPPNQPSSDPIGETHRIPAPEFLVFIIAFFALMFFSLGYGLPVPDVHDEFAYLLGADTFAHGRLTNATHPMHEFFESYHIFHTPTYQSKYPPAQSAFLALGQLISGEAAMGVWISFALACAATTWMLRAVFSRFWACAGGLLGLLMPQIFIAWGQSYWGGAVAWMGSALFLGGLLRMMRTPSAGWAGISGLGLFIMANSRPAESILLCLFLCPAIGYAAWRDESVRRGLHMTFLWPLLVWIGAILAWTGYYNFTLTGDALRFPHVHFAELQPLIEAIQWKGERIPVGERLHQVFTAFLLAWPVLALPVLLMCKKTAGRAMYLLGGVLGMVVLSCGFTAGHPHYYAPLFPVFAGLVIWALSCLPDCFPKRGHAVASGLLILQVLTLGVGLGVKLWQGPPVDYWANKRDNLLRYLENEPGEQKYLVLVDVDPQWPRHHEVVYNRADIDAANVVFARSAGDEANRRLLDYFSDREVVPIHVGE